MFDHISTIIRSRQAPSPTWLAVFCYSVWGFAPLAYIPMRAFGAAPLEIMAHRSVWAFVWAGGLVLITRKWPEVLKALTSPKLLGMLGISALMVATNWGVFVWAVLNGHTIESSLGYYLNPLINMAAGAFLFRERIDGYGKAAIGMAVIGVLVQAIALGHIPWVALTLAVSFAAYGVIRKHLAVDALPGLFVECLLLIVPALAYVLWFEGSGQGHFTGGVSNMFWLMFTGPLTVLPLALFSYVARRMALSTMGFIQFIAPTISFCIGVALGEPFGWLRAMSFVFIWGGAGVFAFGAWRRFRALTQKA